MYRLWAVGNYLFAYRDLMDRPWDQALSEFIPVAVAAKDELEYAQAMARMAARFQDSHVNTVRGSPVLQQWFGGEPQAAVVRFIENRPVVTRLVASVPNGPEVGDEVVAVNGQPVSDRIKRVEPFISYSTPWARDRVLANVIVAGQAGTTSVLTVRRNGQLMDVLTSEHTSAFRGIRPRDGDIIKVLGARIGYLDLDRLERNQVNEAFQQLKNTNGIVFDMRGYPQPGTFQSILTRLQRSNWYADPKNLGDTFGRQRPLRPAARSRLPARHSHSTRVTLNLFMCIGSALAAWYFGHVFYRSCQSGIVSSARYSTRFRRDRDPIKYWMGMFSLAIAVIAFVAFGIAFGMIVVMH